MAGKAKNPASDEAERLHLMVQDRIDEIEEKHGTQIALAVYCHSMGRLAKRCLREQGVNYEYAEALGETLAEDMWLEMVKTMEG